MVGHTAMCIHTDNSKHHVSAHSVINCAYKNEYKQYMLERFCEMIICPIIFLCMWPKLKYAIIFAIKLPLGAYVLKSQN